MRSAHARRDAERADDDFRRLMEDEAFRAFVWRQLTRAHVHETSFHGDALVMAFREGERNAGLALLHDVSRLCPRHYPTMAVVQVSGLVENEARLEIEATAVVPEKPA